MLGYFPKFYPGESIYSAFGRYQEHTVTTNARCWQSLFGDSRLELNADFPRIGSFLSRASMLSGISFEYIVENHTSIPFYRSFYSKEKIKSILEFIRGDKARIGSLSFGSGKNIKYCPLCFEHNQSQYGENFWTVEHNLLPTQICILHKCDLHSLPTSKGKSRILTPNSITVDKTNINLNHDANIQNFHLDLVEFLKNDKELKQQELKELSLSKGFTLKIGERRIIQRRLLSDFTEYCKINTGSTRCINTYAMKKLFSDRWRVPDPELFVVLRNFLNTLPDSIKDVHSRIVGTRLKSDRGIAKDKIKESRSQWIKILTSKDFDCVKKSGIKHQRLYFFLLKYDNNWIKKKNRKYRKKSWTLYSKSDLINRDKGCLEVLKAAHRQLLLQRPEVRINTRSLSEKINKRMYDELEKFPISTDYITTISESHYQFKLRRLTNYILSNRSEKQIFTKRLLFKKFSFRSNRDLVVAISQVSKETGIEIKFK